MRRFTIALATAVSTIALTQVASAADMPRKAPAYVPPPAPVYNWTGFYAGIHLGGGFASNNGDGFATVEQQSGKSPLQTETDSLTTDRNKAFPDLGGQLGYNFQSGAFLFGVETDISYTPFRSRVNVSQEPFDAFITHEEGLDWLGTLRGRLGWVVTPPWLIYATGGLAYGGTRNSLTFTATNPSNPAVFIGQGGTHTRTGWTVGGGTEYMLAPGWSAKLEYKFVDLSNDDFAYGPILITTPNAVCGTRGNCGTFSVIQTNFMSSRSG